MAVDKSMNLAVVLGTVGRDPEVRALQSGGSVGNLSLATDEGYYDKNQQWQDATEWHRITVWNQLCKKLEKIKKGDIVMVQGKIHTDSWDDNTGSKRYSTCIIARTLRHVSDQGRSKAARQAGNYQGQPATQGNFSAPQPQQPYSGQGFGHMPPAPEDDLPF